MHFTQDHPAGSTRKRDNKNSTAPLFLCSSHQQVMDLFPNCDGYVFFHLYHTWPRPLYEVIFSKNVHYLVYYNAQAVAP